MIWPETSMHRHIAFLRGHATTELELNNVGVGMRYLRTGDLLEDMSSAKFDERHCATLPAKAVLKDAFEAVVTIEGFTRQDGTSTVGAACWRGCGLLNNHVVKVESRSRSCTRRFAMYSMLREDNLERLRVAGRGSIAASAGHALEELVMALPPVTEQRRITDFLDTQVARLDAAGEAVAAFQARWEERTEADWAIAYDECAARGQLVTLRRLLRSIADGPFGSSLTSRHYSDEGCRVIRLGNIGVANFRHEDAAYISRSYALELRQHATAPGDVVMAGLGDDRWPLGRTALVPDDLGPAIVKADCYRLRPKSGIQGAFLVAALSAPQTRRTMLLLARGSTRARLNTEVARDVPVALVDGHTQSGFVRQVQKLLTSKEEQARAADHALALLRQRKEALITACVTGEFDVATASSRAAGAALAGAG